MRTSSVERLAVDRSFWKGKRVLITGHTGFKGSWLSLWLQRLEAEVVGYSRLAVSKPSLFELAGVAEDMSSVPGDVRDLDKLATVVKVHRPEIVIHMAAQPLVRKSFADPVETYSTNVMGTVNLLEACRRSDNVRVVVIVTTDRCYQNKDGSRSLSETRGLGGNDPYSSSKACAELVASAYRSSYFSEPAEGDQGIGLATARAGNVFGGGDWAQDRLIPDAMDAFMNGRPMSIRYPNAVRPWQHVLEPLHGYLLLAEHLWTDRQKFSRAWNFGPEDANYKSVSWIVERLAELWGSGATWDTDGCDHLHEAQEITLESKDAKTQLNWSPKLSIGESLELTVAWYRAYKQRKDMRVVTCENLEFYDANGTAKRQLGL